MEMLAVERVSPAYHPLTNPKDQLFFLVQVGDLDLANMLLQFSILNLERVTQTFRDTSENIQDSQSSKGVI